MRLFASFYLMLALPADICYAVASMQIAADAKGRVAGPWQNQTTQIPRSINTSRPIRVFSALAAAGSFRVMTVMSSRQILTNQGLVLGYRDSIFRFRAPERLSGESGRWDGKIG